MTPATVHSSTPFPVTLGLMGAAVARCRVCRLVPGQRAWADHRLLGLYCGPDCCNTALFEVQHQAPRPYVPDWPGVR